MQSPKTINDDDHVALAKRLRDHFPNHTVTIGGSPTLIDSPDLLDLRATCALIGGSKPIHPATLYRGVRKGRYPKPIHIGPGSSRWLRTEIEAVLKAMIAGRAAQ
jgi:predicted DNA-binding transcriptional regulator AlpA